MKTKKNTVALVIATLGAIAVSYGLTFGVVALAIGLVSAVSHYTMNWDIVSIATVVIYFGIFAINIKNHLTKSK